jgi:hypothetical protein
LKLALSDLTLSRSKRMQFSCNIFIPHDLTTVYTIYTYCPRPGAFVCCGFFSVSLTNKLTRLTDSSVAAPSLSSARCLTAEGWQRQERCHPACGPPTLAACTHAYGTHASRIYPCVESVDDDRIPTFSSGPTCCDQSVSSPFCLIVKYVSPTDVERRKKPLDFGVFKPIIPIVTPFMPTEMLICCY